MSLHFTVKLHVNEDIPGRNCLQEHAILFEERFSRCDRLLHFLAFRILGSHEMDENKITAVTRRGC
jgi:hypothetical protein